MTFPKERPIADACLLGGGGHQSHKKIKNYGEIELTQTKGRHEPNGILFLGIQRTMRSKKSPSVTDGGRFLKRSYSPTYSQAGRRGALRRPS